MGRDLLALFVPVYLIGIDRQSFIGPTSLANTGHPWQNRARMDEGSMIEISGLRALAGRYDGIICDLWGVIYDGVRRYPGALETLELAADQGVRLVFLSNAPSPSPLVAERLAKYGIGPDLYRTVVTSGDATRTALTHLPPGRKIYLLGPDRHLPMFDALPLELTPLDQADLIVCTGPFEDRDDSLDDYQRQLAPAALRRVPMICANPDLAIVQDGQMVYCAGTLAAIYEELGGSVTYYGKPDPHVIDLALAALGTKRSRTLVIGDGLRTDIKGAASAQLDAWLIADGVNAEEMGLGPGPLDLPRILNFARQNGGEPQYVSRRLMP
jgi:HAD superfamily hydrolase (TIGR01459 family)